MPTYRRGQIPTQALISWQHIILVSYSSAALARPCQGGLRRAIFCWSPHQIFGLRRPSWKRRASAFPQRSSSRQDNSPVLGKPMYRTIAKNLHRGSHHANIPSDRVSPRPSSPSSTVLYDTCTTNLGDPSKPEAARPQTPSIPRRARHLNQNRNTAQAEPPNKLSYFAIFRVQTDGRL